ILKEIDRLGLQTKDFIPKTGDPTINRIITKATGAILDNINDVLENSKVYQKSSDDAKIGIIKTLISEAKSTAKGKAAKDIAQVVYEELAKEKKESRVKLVEQLKNKGLLTENILDFLLPMIESKRLK
ncbi:hypothetical protein HYT51_02765, partial [Candidatus Woesearchaeota archaeon]|nr:hypothetical protein [Candidatus Woesearchaeota archaeon]